jgi:membrane-bound inhibitor of C-type lysozyme
MRLLAGLGLLVLAACAGTSSASEPTAVRFVCERGTVLSIRFEEEAALVDTGSGEPLRLPQEPSGSGFRYGTPRHMIVGKGDDLTWTVGRMVPEKCRVAR